MKHLLFHSAWARNLSQRLRRLRYWLIKHRRTTAIVALASGLVATLIFLIVWAPGLLAPPLHHSDLTAADVQGKDIFSLQNDRSKLQNDIRTTLLQGLAGVIVAIGAYATWRQVHNSQEVHSTERFIRAVEQLGRSEQTLEIALGGLYGLERVARDSPRDRRSIAEILTAFVRARNGDFMESDDATVGTLLRRAPQVQAAVAIIGRGAFSDIRLFHEEDIRALDFSGTDLRHADLSHGDFRAAWMSSARLFRAFAVSANLSWIDFGGAEMRLFIGNGTKFHGAWFHSTDCSDAHFDHADFSETICQRTNFQGCHLVGADFENAFLGEANFAGANLSHAKFTGAVADEATVWPTDFDPDSHGIHLEPREKDRPPRTPPTTTREERERVAVAQRSSRKGTTRKP